jgi:amidase
MGGTKVMESHIPQYDAPLVRKLKAAGAIILGKLNLTEGAMRGYNRARQIPKNPWGIDRWSGASSSGSGVAVSAGFCFGALGSDTGGSIRFPSASCGIVGLKPTYGAISRHGVIPLAESLDHVGPMTRSVIDAVYMFNAMIGHDPNDETSLNRCPVDISIVQDDQLDGLRIGYGDSYSEHGIDPELVTMVRGSLRKLESLGASIHTLEIPNIDEYLPAWRVLCASEAYRAHTEYYPDRQQEYGEFFSEWLSIGSEVTATDYIAANNLRMQCNGIFNRTFEHVDAMICPTTTTFPEVIDDKSNYGPMVHNWPNPGEAPHQRFTVPFDFNGYPTISVPCGINEEDLPGSLQIIGKPGTEQTIARIANAFEIHTKWKDMRPIF